MRVALLSDIHLEICPYPYKLPDVDVLILAGDIANGVDGILWALANTPEKTHIVYVPGNHEYYRRDLIQLRSLFLDIADWGERCHVLDNKSVVIDGKRFFGATLWTDYKIHGDQDECMRLAMRYMNDHRLIFMDKDIVFTPGDALEFHEQTIGVLEKFVKNKVPIDVVVTHHGPAPGSESPRFRDNELNGAFYSDLRPLIKKVKAPFWFHGHTHDSCDYKVGKTRVVTNPRGYAPRDVPFAAENSLFDPYLVFDV